MSTTASALQVAFSNAIVQSNLDCNVNALLKYSVPLSSGIRYHTLITIIGGVAALLCLLISGFLMLGHLSNWVVPNEQRQLVRAIFTLPVFAVCSFFSILFYDAEGFLNPIPQIFESFGIVALFYFYVTCVTPNESLREQFFDNLERKKFSRAKGNEKHPNGSLRWFHVHWIMVFQLLLGRIATTITYEYIEATRCPLSRRLMRGVLIISGIQSLQTIIAVTGVIQYERRMSQHLKGHRAAFKLWSFKLIVLVELVQTLIFKGLGSAFILKPTKYVSYRDITVGTPQFMLCCEMFLFSIVFLWSYSFMPYRRMGRDRPGDKRTFFRGLADTANISDILNGVVFMFRTIQSDRFGTNITRDVEEHKADEATRNHDLSFAPSADSTLNAPQGLYEVTEPKAV